METPRRWLSRLMTGAYCQDSCLETCVQPPRIVRFAMTCATPSVGARQHVHTFEHVKEHVRNC